MEHKGSGVFEYVNHKFNLLSLQELQYFRLCLSICGTLDLLELTKL